MRDVKLKNGKWVYNCAKLWYTNKNFLTFGRFCGLRRRSDRFEYRFNKILRTIVCGKAYLVFTKASFCCA